MKEAVFPFARFPNVDTILGPEMKSTGEVMGLDASFERAFAKSQLGAGDDPAAGRHGVPVGEGRRQEGTRRRSPADWSRWASRILATRGTAARIREAGLPVTVVNKVLEGRPHCVDAIRSGEMQLVVNTASTPAIGGRQLRHPPQRADPWRAALHHHGRRPGGGARHRRPAGGDA